MKELPTLYNRKEECCGCTACYAICPKEAISMVEDEEGFIYPVINNILCIQCYRCVKVCPIKEVDNNE
ncbi:(Fe-S)-binding protein [Clostridium sp. chh4-2]|uniref:NADH-quinone oxidoreductase subunit I n=1 Tax=Clostridium sp. chh4-2 TaxID=2067550 RepID=UPI000CCED6DE|nr:4Fe-4S dicluster domain-containing protein [Clostridium sp. chh4-2]PNV60598.1 (Fe-S)-binding protein [Clostridium sp. chh4-2]